MSTGLFFYDSCIECDELSIRTCFRCEDDPGPDPSRHVVSVALGDAVDAYVRPPSPRPTSTCPPFLFPQLLVMLYEYVILTMIILGLALGHLVTLRLTAPQRRAATQAGSKTPPEVMGSSGTPCCNNDTCA